MICEWCQGIVAEDAGPCPKSLTCPRCEAPPGSPCQRPSGHRAADMHVGRIKLAEQPVICDCLMDDDEHCALPFGHLGPCQASLPEGG